MDCGGCAGKLEEQAEGVESSGVVAGTRSKAEWSPVVLWQAHEGKLSGCERASRSEKVLGQFLV